MDSESAIPFATAIVRDTTELALPRERRWLEPTLLFLGRRCRHNGVSSELVQARLGLACREALEEAMRRNKLAGKPLRMQVRFEPGRCAVELADELPWNDNHRLVDSTETPGPTSRRRLNLIRTLVDDFELADEGRTLRLCFISSPAMEARRPSAVPFVNPVEVFPLHADGCIDYDMTYQAVFKDVTDAGITLLQQRVKIPKQACIGVYGAGRLYFLPATLASEQEPIPGFKEAHFRFGTPKKQKATLPRLDAPFEEAQIVESMKALVEDVKAKSDVKHHRRAHERILFSDKPIKLKEAPEGKPVFARDLSAGGMALITTFPLEVGAAVTVELPAPAGDSHSVPLRIVRCLPLIDDFFDVGGEFQDGHDGEAGMASA